MRRIARFGLLLAALLLAGQAGGQAQVSNTAVASFNDGRGPVTLSSNTLTFDVESAPPVRAASAPPPLTMLLTMMVSPGEASAGDVLDYRLTLTNRGEDATAPRIVIVLPPGLRYVGGSARGATEGVVARDGRTIELLPGSVPPGATIDLRFAATVNPGAPLGEAVAGAVARLGAWPISNEAAAAVRLRAALFTDAMTILGRVERGPCGTPTAERHGVPGIRLLLENGMSIVTDRDGLYHLEGVRPGRHVVQIDPATLSGRYAALLCTDDTRAAGSATARFVEADGGGVQRVDFRLRETGADAAPDPAPARADDAAAAGDRDWLREARPGAAILFPAPDYNPRAPVTRVVVAHRPGERVALRIDDRTVDPLSFDTTDTDAARGVAVSRWTGLALHPGANRIVARVLAADGAPVAVLERVVTVAGTPARVVVDPARSRLRADGHTRPLIALHVEDADGRPVRDGTVLRFAVDAPYAAAGDAALDQRRAAAGQIRETTGRVVGDEGIAFVALEPTGNAGAVRLSVALGPDRSTPPVALRAWLEAAARDWIVVGFTEGTLGHDLLARHREDGRRANGRAALYAKGRIKGSWLLTLAYDSARLRDRDAPVRGSIDPDRYYIVYGDASRQSEDANGGGTLYLRIERRDAYVLFGDMETGLGETQLLRYLRSVDGVKAAYEGPHLRASGFVARPSSGHVRDEIRGGGVTGPYRLSTRGIVPDSDTVTIEIRDRLRSERIVSRRTLTRHIDYELDSGGTIRFREPLLSRDLAQDAVFGIVEYETDGTGGGKTIAGGRIAVVRGRVELGASALRDEGAGDATVLGADVKLRVGASTVLRGEVGGGGRGGLGAGAAYLAEAEHHDAALDLLAYVRQQDAGFGVGQLNAVEAGTRKIGLDARAVLAPLTVLTTSAWTQALLDGSATRSSAEARIERARDGGSLYLGAQFALERAADARDRTTRLLKLGGSRVLAGGALVVTGETQIGASDASAAFPLRQRISARYRLLPAVRLVGGYEVISGGPQQGATAQAGLDVTPWSGASVTGMLNRRTGSEEPGRVFAVYGIDQSVTLGPRWHLNATLDASSTLAGGGGTVGVAPDPFGAGATEDFTAATLGASYRAARWSWTGRLEYRTSPGATRLGLTGGVLRALGEGRTLAAGFKAYRSAGVGGAVARYAEADLALALRPPTSRWSLLDRIELRHQHGDVTIGGGDIAAAGTTSRAINNLALDYRSAGDGGHGVEASLYYGVKCVAGAGGGVVDMIGLAVRRDLSSRLDIGVQASVQHGWKSGALAYSIGPTLGVSPARGTWISVGYNLRGFHDPDFSGAAYSRAGPFLTVRLKFDQTSLGLTRR